MTAIEEGKSADDQLAKLWAGLGSRASDELLRKASEKLLRPAGDPLFQHSAYTFPCVLSAGCPLSCIFKAALSDIQTTSNPPHLALASPLHTLFDACRLLASPMDQMKDALPSLPE